MNFAKNKKGFSLIELIIYIGISTFVLVGTVNFSWNVISSNERVEVGSELTQNGRLIFDKFTQEVRVSEDVDLGSSTFDLNPGVLTLERTGVGNDVIFNTYVKNIILAGQVVPITKISFTDGVNPPVDLSSDRVDVTNFVFRNRTRDDEPANIELHLTLEYVNPGSDLERNKDLTLTTAVSIRK